ncbi:hypothetical protein [Bacillus solimangrovi]|uniref:Lipoprotein n=1 Tax=Bacillus solimangrovi TaxID=1305675 RepID=A0A1E5LHS5_9BACI|nr:hypothetical protein [Bacillus solimangrovi]OEH93633.1 hypothetical protein BFG57_01205 [Bacillus solimangrovi]
MKKHFFIIPLTLIIFMTGCNQTELKEQVEQLTEENVVLVAQVSNLQDDIRKQERKIKDLNIDVAVSERNIKKLDVNLEISKDTNSKLEREIEAIINEIGEAKFAEQYGIYNLSTVSKGMRVRDLTVTDVTKKEHEEYPPNYFVDFDGQFEVSGSIYHSQVADSIVFSVHPNSIKNMPRTVSQAESEHIVFNVSNTDELKERLGDKLAELDGLDGQMQMRAVFEDYTFLIMHATDAISYAKLVEIVSFD